MAAADSVEISRNRLPNLWEVLSRSTKAPVDLYSFYIYMRDQQRSVDYLDFWLDVSQHMSLCRHYVRGLRRSALADTPELTGSKRSSQILDHYGNTDYNDTAPTGPFILDKANLDHPDQRVSDFLRTQTNGSGNSQHHSPSHSHDSADPTSGARPSYMQSSHSNSGNDNSPIGNNVSRQDIRASAEKILYTYLLQGSEREIIIPVGILNDITHAIEVEGRDDPEVFDAAKDYVFQAMERDAFPGFLRAKALGNIIHPSMLLRLIVGLVAMFGALWTAFVLIFLDCPRSTRCWVSPVFSLLALLYFAHC